MKFIDEFDIELVNQALQFETIDCHINGGCDLFSTKAAGQDKKLYRIINDHIDNMLKENTNIAIKPPKPNPYYSRSFSSVLVNGRRSNSFGASRRRNSEGVSEVLVSDLSSNYNYAPGSSRRSSSNNDVKEVKAFRKITRNADAAIKEKDSNTKETSERPASASGPNVTSEDQETAEKGTDAPSGTKSTQIVVEDEEVNGSDLHTPPTDNSKVLEIVVQSPFGPLNDSNSRKTFAYLIGILNSTYPDHDFTLLEPQDFQRSSPTELIDKFNNTMIKLGKVPMEWIWDTLDTHVGLYDSTVYLYVPSDSFLEDEPGSLWSVMWFILNKKKNRVAYLYLNAIKRSMPFRNPEKRRTSITIDESDEDSEDIYDGYEEYEEVLMSDIDEQSE